MTPPSDAGRPPRAPSGPPRWRRRALHAGVVSLALLPVLGLALAGARGELGANPVETLSHETGQWTLRLLLATLAVTPARRWLRWRWVAPYRRTLGLLAFGYACLHFSIYLGFDLSLDIGALAEDVAERPYLTVGFTGFVLLWPLALTSTRAAARRLGRRWKQIHRLVYAVVVCGVLHFLWAAKADIAEPLVYAAVAGALLALRLPWRRLRDRRHATRATAPLGPDSR